MQHRIGISLTVGLFVAVVCSAADPQIASQPSLPETTRGQHVTISGQGFPAGQFPVYLRQNSDQKVEDAIQLTATQTDEKTLTFPVPPGQVPVGRYLVRVRMNGKDYDVPGDLKVIADASAPVKLDAVYPVTAYPKDHTGFDFDIAGQNLAADPNDNTLLVVGRGPVSALSPDECKAAETSKIYARPCLKYEPGMATRKLSVVGFPKGDYDGPISVQVQVGSNVSNAVPLTFSRVSERGALWGALLSFLVIMAIVVRLVWRGVGDYKIGKKRFGPWTSFFLDKETNSYSLSKFQLLAWTSAFVFGYLYLFLARMLIQWKFELPPVPDGMPGMLAISAATAVAAAGATESRGSKGAGPVHPSAADFVSTGGLVVGERFQFFVWTLVGVGAFVSMLLLKDPATLIELPKVPDNFLYLMGISSAGYIAGKVTRKPGPVIRALSITGVATSSGGPMTMSMHLKGENLAENATVKVDDTLLRDGQFSIKGTDRPAQPVDPAFCNELDLVLNDAEGYMEGQHTLAIINRDAQQSSAEFPIDPMVIETVADVTHGAAKTAVKVTGKNFAANTAAGWNDAAGTATPIAAADVVLNKDKPGELTVTLVPGNHPGKGKLTLISPAKLRASHEVKVT